MALVAYDYSDESEPENDEDVEVEVVVRTQDSNKKKIDLSKLELSDGEDDALPVTRSFLPAPSNPEPMDSDRDQKDRISSLLCKLPPSKVKKNDLSGFKSKLPGPVLSQSEKDDEDRIKKAVGSLNNGGDLSSVLPPPQNEYSLESSEKKKKTTNTPLLPYNFLKSKPMGSQNDEKKPTNDEDEDIDPGTDFFSLSKNDAEDLPEPIEIELQKPKFNITKYFKDEVPGKSTDTDDMDTSEDYTVPKKPENFTITYEDTVPQNTLNLDEKTMQRYFGRKRKKEVPDDLNVIDVRQDHMLADTKRLITKQLTEEEPVPRSLGKFNNLSKRKHQITYLAYMAKEREVELKNMWAQNRLTKKQTQQKYGF